MPWHGPTHPDDFPTLGWAVLDHMAEHLPSPGNPSEPFILTDEQARIVLRWYELDPMTGEFAHRRGRLEMAKGWGKSPLLAGIAIEEFAGPTSFGGWDAAGEPIAVRQQWPVVEIAAVSEDQTDNTYAALYAMLTANEGRAAKRLGIDIGRTRLYLAEGRPGTLRPVTAESASREGARLTFAVLDETHLWTPRNGGTKLAATLRRNATKMGGRTFETTNAPVLGERSVAEESGDDPTPGVLHIARRARREPSLDWPEDELRAELVYVYGDSYWAPIERILAELGDPASAWDDALRFWFNLRTTGTSRAVDVRQWDALVVRREVDAGSLVGAGFDGSTSHDATVIRACTKDGYSFIWRYWARPPGVQEWRVPRDEVDQAVAELFERYFVGLMLCDPPGWRTEIERWQERWPDRVVALDTNSPRRMVPVVDRWRTGVASGAHTHDGDPFTDQQVKATRLRKVHLADDVDDRTRYMLEKDGHFGNDAAIADALAYEAAMTIPADLVDPNYVPEFAFT